MNASYACTTRKRVRFRWEARILLDEDGCVTGASELRARYYESGMRGGTAQASKQSQSRSGSQRGQSQGHAVATTAAALQTPSQPSASGDAVGSTGCSSHGSSSACSTHKPDALSAAQAARAGGGEEGSAHVATTGVEAATKDPAAAATAKAAATATASARAAAAAAKAANSATAAASASKTEAYELRRGLWSYRSWPNGACTSLCLLLLDCALCKQSQHSVPCIEMRARRFSAVVCQCDCKGTLLPFAPRGGV
eukprot:6201289-Pleurochrysis_carterae.AAC.1